MRSNGRSAWRQGAALAGVIVLAATSALSADKLDEAIQVRTAGNESSAASQETIDKLSEDTDALVQEYRRLLQEAEALDVYNEQVEDLLDSQRKEAQSLQGQIDQVALVGRQLTPLMLEMIDALDSFVQLDVPFLPEERNNRVAQLRELMARADVSNSEKFRRILEAYQIENEYGRTIEAYRGTLDVSGATRTVDFLRVGRIALVYQTLDGAEMGVWSQQERQWSELPGDYRVAIRQGLRIARKQAAPDLILLPVAAAEEAK